MLAPSQSRPADMHNAQYDQIEALLEISRMQRAAGVVVVAQKEPRK
jgi:hypothetical protein